MARNVVLPTASWPPEDTGRPLPTGVSTSSDIRPPRPPGPPAGPPPPAAAARVPLFLVPESSFSPVESTRLEVSVAQEQVPEEQVQEETRQEGQGSPPGGGGGRWTRLGVPAATVEEPRAWAVSAGGTGTRAGHGGPVRAPAGTIRWRSQAATSPSSAAYDNYDGDEARLPLRGRSLGHRLKLQQPAPMRVVHPPGRRDAMAAAFFDDDGDGDGDGVLSSMARSLLSPEDREKIVLRRYGIISLRRRTGASATIFTATASLPSNRLHPSLHPQQPGRRDPDPQEQRRPQQPTQEQEQQEQEWVEGPVPLHLLFELGTARPLWLGCEHALAVGQRLPPVCGGETVIFSFVAAPSHFACAAPDYLRATFSRTTQVFVLLPSINPIPQWLLRDFNQLPASEARLKVTWRLGWPWAAFAVVDRRLGALAGAWLRVWERKELCAPEQEYAFGGTEGSFPGEDFTYLLAWHAVNDVGPKDGDVEKPSSILPVPVGIRSLGTKLAGTKEPTDGAVVPRRFDAATWGLDIDQFDPRALMAHVVNAVLGSELDHLRKALSLYMRRCHEAEVLADASVGGDSWPAPDFRTHDGELLTRAAISYRAPRGSGVQLAILLYLVGHGAELDVEGFRYVALNARGIPRCSAGAGPDDGDGGWGATAGGLRRGQYRDLRHVALSYVARQRNPVASAMEMAMILDDCAEEDRAQAAGWRALASTLRGVAVRLLGCLESPKQGEQQQGGRDGQVQDRGEQEQEEGALRGSGSGSGSSGGLNARGAADGADGDGRDAGGGGHGGGGVGSVEELGRAAALAAVGAVLDPYQARGREGGSAASGGGEGGGSGDGEGGGGREGGEEDDEDGDGRPINDGSPLQIAYGTKDLDFISAPVVQLYLRDRWLGADYISQALEDTGFVFSEKDHHRLLRFMEDLGFVGGLGRPVIRCVSEVVHVLVYAGRAFSDSPRGRWVFQLVAEAGFLYIYHAVQLGKDETVLTWQHVVLLLYVIGMVVDELLELTYEYGGHVASYFSSGVNMVDTGMLAMLGGCIALKIAMWSLPGGQSNPSWSDLAAAKSAMYNGAAVLVWGRLLPYLIPLHRGVGSNLMVMKQMFGELMAFAVLYVALLTGITFALYGMFRERGISGLGSFPEIMLGLFRTFLGETIFDLFPEDPDLLYNLYGNIVTILYVLLAAVVLANLLIALMTAHFQSDKLEAQSRFEMAKMLSHYEAQSVRHLLVAPYSLPYILIRGLLRLPSGPHRPRDGRWRRLLWLLPLPPPDGPAGVRYEAAATAAAAPTAGGSSHGRNGHDSSRCCCHVPTGSNELPYLAYLLVMYPVQLAFTWVLYICIAPYCLLYFTFVGYKNVARITPHLLPADLHRYRYRAPAPAVDASKAAAAAAAVPSVLRQVPQLVPEEDGAAYSPGAASPRFGVHPVSPGGLPGIVQAAEDPEITETADDAAAAAVTAAAGGTGTDRTAEALAAAEEPGDAATQRDRQSGIGPEASGASLPTPALQQLPTEPASPAASLSAARSPLPPPIYFPSYNDRVVRPRPRLRPAPSLSPSRRPLSAARERSRAARRAAGAAPRPPTSFRQILLRVVRGYKFVLSRPLYLALGAAVYVTLGCTVLVIWLGLVVWPSKLAFHGYWVLWGWGQGFGIGVARPPPASSSGRGAAAGADDGRGGDRGDDVDDDGGGRGGLSGDGGGPAGPSVPVRDVSDSGSGDGILGRAAAAAAAAAPADAGPEAAPAQEGDNERNSVAAEDVPQVGLQRRPLRPQRPRDSAGGGGRIGGGGSAMRSRLRSDSVFTPTAILEALQAGGVPREEAEELAALDDAKLKKAMKAVATAAWRQQEGGEAAGAEGTDGAPWLERHGGGGEAGGDVAAGGSGDDREGSAAADGGGTASQLAPGGGGN